MTGVFYFALKREPNHAWKNMTNAAVKRSTEGSRPGKRGRPKGSRNRAKTLLGRELATKLMEHMQSQLSPEQFEYLKGVVRDGKPMQTKQEIDTLITLLTRNLYPAIIQEMMPEDEGGLGGEYRKDVTDRLKLVRELLTLRHAHDKTESQDDGNSNETILTITGRRGLDLGRLGILVSSGADRLGGGDNGTGRTADDIRALPDTLSERQEPIPHREQGTADRILDGSEYRDFARGDDEAEIQG